ncbi:auxin-responsive family protein [Striga asiatica]|uniref:Cytochrome b561 and DOMON domain-containing protein n=1 Tax=Striga asiatica TaxID=4170 RepID=A0A5A7RBS4_STRAF|nr:auxin-responsive family protein [Striga asiatica]
MVGRTSLGLIVVLVSMVAYSSYAQTNCSNYRFSNGNELYATCVTLPVLDSFLHWTYQPSNHTLNIAYRHTRVTASNWVAWALNPGGRGMSGAQCLVALVDPSSSTPRAYTSAIALNDYRTTLQQNSLSFQVPSLSAEFRDGQEMIIRATIQLPPGRTSFNQVWQVGPLSPSGQPQQHASTSANLGATNNLDFATGTTLQTGGGSGGGSRQRRRNTHGVLNVVSWGILMPIGAMTARYLKVFKVGNPAWFYLHVTCQATAYVVGVAGWATGLKLGSDSPGIERTTHRNIGITLFVLGTLQAFALLLRPKPDHKYRIFWNIYHHSIGYSVIALSIANIFEGFDILDPERKWRRAYIGVLIALGAIALFLEPLTWFIVIKRKRDSSKHAPNGTNGYIA